MGRYPFLTYLRQYAEEMRPYKAEATLKQEVRQLRRIHKSFQYLKAQGLVSTTNPQRMKEKDVGAFLLHIKHLDINTRAKYTQYLRNLFTFCGNVTLELMRQKKMLPRLNHRKEISVLTRGEVNQVLSAAIEIEGWEGEVLRMMLPTYYYTGLRPSELRKAKLCDLDLEKGNLKVSSPKGQGSWGVQRTVRIPPPLRATVMTYLDKRQERLRELEIEGNEYLIPNLSPYNVTGKPYTGQSFIRLKHMVEELCGIRFELRQLRRTSGQHLKDAGVSIEAISKMLGHSSTTVTEKYYSRIRDEQAYDLIEKGWDWLEGQV